LILRRQPVVTLKTGEVKAPASESGLYEGSQSDLRLTSVLWRSRHGLGKRKLQCFGNMINPQVN
jgi:hypothetical protein